MEASNEWELAKENFQPLKQGREPQRLNEAVDAPTPEKSVIDKQKRQFWAEIEAYNGPDPLEPWIRFVKWTQKTYLAGGRQAELLPLLERCTRELRQMPGYDDDIRYLRLWLQYADCLPQPQDVFAFLMENEIGQNHALFYMAYAAFMELRGNFGKAEAVFEMGLDRMAKPIHKLRAKHKDFQERMDRRKVREAQEGSSSASKLFEPQRTVLGVLKGSSKTTRPPAHSRPAQSTSGVIAPRKTTSATQRRDKENSVAELSIFTDDRFKDDAAPARPDYNLSSNSTSGGWKQLTDFQSTRKENERVAAHGRASKLKQKKNLMPALDPELDIPEDEDLLEAQPKHLDVAKGTLRQRLDSSRTRPIEESLMNDPLKLIKKSEEAQQPEVHKTQKDSDGGQKNSAISKPDARDFSTFAAGHTGPLFARRQHDSVDNTLGTIRGDRDAVDTSRLPEITLNTREAFDQVNEMFKGALPKDCLWQSSEPTTTIRFGEATCNVTMSTKAAYDAINSMFGPSSIQSSQPKGRPASAKSSNDQTGLFDIYEDTSFLDKSAAERNSEDATSAFQVYEDTDFISAKPGRPSSASADQTDGFTIYQDTECFTANLRNAQERPEVKGRQQKASLGQSSTVSNPNRAHPRSDNTDSFFVFEDDDL